MLHSLTSGRKSWTLRGAIRHMSTQGPQSLIDRYLDALGAEAGAPSRLPMQEVLWLIEHATRLGVLRLRLLRALQAALPRSEGVAAELKDLLTDLIIMHSRLADRDSRLKEKLGQVVGAGTLSHVPVDEADLRDAIREMAEAIAHLRAVAGPTE